MKLRLAILFLFVFLVTPLLFGQKKGKEEPEKFLIMVGGTFAKPKIIPAMDKLAITQLRVNYKMTTTARAMTNAKKDDGIIAGAKITASVETTDGQLTPADFQEITDHGYSYFQKVLNDNGIATVAWDVIAATEFYKSGDEDTKEKTEKSDNVYYTSVANNGNVLYAGVIGFAGGKGKKAAKFCEEVGAPAAFFNVTVEFADIYIDIDGDDSETSNMYVIKKTRTMKYNSAVQANMKTIPTGQKGFSMLFNEKYVGEGLALQRDIDGMKGYETGISQDPSKMKNNPFRFAKEMVPVVIETTRQGYKDAAKKALENYANEFVAMVNAKKKSS